MSLPEDVEFEVLYHDIEDIPPGLIAGFFGPVRAQLDKVKKENFPEPPEEEGQDGNAAGGAKKTEKAPRGFAQRGPSAPTPPRVRRMSRREVPAPAKPEEDVVKEMKKLNIEEKEPKPKGSKPRGMDEK
ncbi:hypothetical protein TNCT_665151 [Trichonephila clavata]|uniref:Uncharacterized protein n=1 Tax=Trichonephila clavata TaxID=2740835 RepID=A0A8X6H0X1_TRICU|nr:hypothetical protein TNCT_665151 [Trichonephila clavata]